MSKSGESLPLASHVVLCDHLADCFQILFTRTSSRKTTSQDQSGCGLSIDTQKPPHHPSPSHGRFQQGEERRRVEGDPFSGASACGTVSNVGEKTDIRLMVPVPHPQAKGYRTRWYWKVRQVLGGGGLHLRRVQHPPVQEHDQV